MSTTISHLIILFVVFIHCCTNDTFERSNIYALKVNRTYKYKMMLLLKDNGFTLLYKISPERFIIEYVGSDTGSRVLTELSALYRNQITSWEPVRIYNKTLKLASGNGSIPPLNQSTVSCGKYDGMGIEDVWLLGYSGKGVNIAINDVGINVDLPDLKTTIESSLSYNFISDSLDVSPENITDMSSEALDLTNHGNRIANVVAGIAFNSKLTALKIFEVNSQNGMVTSGYIITQSFLHNLDDIDIYVNAWRLSAKFGELDLTTLAALNIGATTGRRNLGIIYLVPTGTTGNGFTNNIYTITVGGIGRFGTVPSDAMVDASVITSGLTEGNNITARTTNVTAFKNNTCVNRLRGTSLATAQIAGIIALGLEANPYLSQRDILHLLVKASEKDGLNDPSKFQKNGAGLYVHAYFGFGLLNAMRFVELAERGISTSELITTTFTFENKRNKTDIAVDVLLCYHCANVKEEEHCVTNIEYVEVSMKFITDTEFLKITVISPSNTESLLMDDKTEKRGFQSTIECSFVSVHFWDELPFGIWKIRIQPNLHNDQIDVSYAKITVYGTHSVDMMRLNIKNDLCRNLLCLR